MKKTLITGANGFIGGHLTRLLAERGRPVRAFVERGKDYSRIADLDVEIVEGDVRDEASLTRAIKNCDVIHHLAAYNQLWSPNFAQLFDINVKGTKRLLEIARMSGVEKFIYTSSATLFRNNSGKLASEDDFLRSAPKNNGYTRSKYLAEKEVVKFSERGLFAVSLAPTAVVGAGDINLTGPGRLILDFLCRKLSVYLDTGFNVVDVRRVVEAHVAAETQGRNGEHYIIGGVNIPLVELLRELEELTGIPAPTITIPYWFAYGAACVNGWMSDYVTRKAPTVALEGVRSVRRPCYYNCEKAQRELGLQESDVRSSLAESIRWFCAQRPEVSQRLQLPLKYPALAAKMPPGFMHLQNEKAALKTQSI